MNWRTLSSKQLEIMDIFWENDDPMTLQTVSEQHPMDIRKIERVLQRLKRKGFIRPICKENRSHNETMYIPCITKENYTLMCAEQLSKMTAHGLIAIGIMHDAYDKQILEDLVQMLERDKQQL